METIRMKTNGIYYRFYNLTPDNTDPENENGTQYSLDTTSYYDLTVNECTGVSKFAYLDESTSEITVQSTQGIEAIQNLINRGPTIAIRMFTDDPYYEYNVVKWVVGSKNTLYIDSDTKARYKELEVLLYGVTDMLGLVYQKNNIYTDYILGEDGGWQEPEDYLFYAIEGQPVEALSRYFKDALMATAPSNPYAPSTVLDYGLQLKGVHETFEVSNLNAESTSWSLSFKVSEDTALASLSDRIIPYRQVVKLSESLNKIVIGFDDTSATEPLQIDSKRDSMYLTDRALTIDFTNPQTTINVACEDGRFLTKIYDTDPGQPIGLEVYSSSQKGADLNATADSRYYYNRAIKTLEIGIASGKYNAYSDLFPGRKLEITDGLGDEMIAIDYMIDGVEEVLEDNLITVSFTLTEL